MYISNDEAALRLKEYVKANFRNTTHAGDFFCCSGTHVSNCQNGNLSLTKRMRAELGLTKVVAYVDSNDTKIVK